MDKMPYTNHQSHVVHIGSTMVRPGETRMVDPRLVGKAAPAPVDPGPPPPDPVLAILDGSIAEVTAGLEALSDDELGRLEQGEQSGKTRKGVLEAIAAERIRRAQ